MARVAGWATGARPVSPSGRARRTIRRGGARPGARRRLRGALLLAAIGPLALLLAGAPPGPALAQSAGGGSLYGVVGAMYGIDPWLLRAIAATESNGDPEAVSRAGALGLMQLMPETARRFGVTAPFDPLDSLLGAARYLRWLSDAGIGGDKSLELAQVLAAYNAGEQAVRRYRGIPPYSETRRYVRRVLLAYGVRDGGLAAAPAQRRRGGASTTRPGSPDRALLAQLAALRRARAQAAQLCGAPAVVGR